MARTARARLRGQSLGWLQSELAAWAKFVEPGSSQARRSVAQTLEHWKADPGLASVREPGATPAPRLRWNGSHRERANPLLCSPLVNET